MKILTPLGLLGLLGILVLILIYIIKPNYQQKYISSTYVWKLSLKYKKKKIPTSRLRDLLLILCQILAITCCAMLLATPSQVLRQQPEEGEVIVIVDASASMRATTDDETRFIRAVRPASELSDKILKENGTVSVILANDNPAFLNKRASNTEAASVSGTFGDLMQIDGYNPVYCSYGNGDIDGALELCEDIVAENPKTLIYIYTDKEYDYLPANVRVQNVKASAEWNAAILNAYTTFESGYYTLTVEIASYNRDATLGVNVVVSGANKNSTVTGGTTLTFEAKDIECTEETTTVVFRAYGEDGESEDGKTKYIVTEGGYYSFDSILVYLDENDSDLMDNYSEDDSFSVYGGIKPTLKVMYSSFLDGQISKNAFVTDILIALRKNYSDIYNIELDEQAEEAKGYDLYIFEHTMPETMPDDGVVFLLDPLSAPTRSGFTVRGVRDLNKIPTALTEDDLESGRSPLLKNITVSDIEVTRYNVFGNYEGYTSIASCNGESVMFVKNEIDSKVFVMGFSVHYSNIGLETAWPLLFNNLFNYFMPPTVNGNAFEVYSEITINSMGTELNLKRISSDNDESTTFNQFPAKVKLSVPGTYNISQTGFLGKEVEDTKIYVKIPAAESNIAAREDTVYDPFTGSIKYDYFKDLLIYFAAALVALLFIEWILQLRDNM